MDAPRENDPGPSRRSGGRARSFRVRLAAGLVLGGAAAVSTACAAPDDGDAQATGGNAVQVFTESDDGRRVELSDGETFEVRLRATPGTGYGWTVSEPAPSELELLTDQLEGPADGAPGAEEVHSFRFRAREPGAAELRMVYRRAWEEGVEPLRTFSLDVNIED